MLREFKADLHIHTCLSPCAETEMTPRMIVEQAVRRGLDIIGICDHNSAENLIYVKKAAESQNITVIGGMEITSKEEVHILALFDNEEKLFGLQKYVYDNLPGENNEDVFGRQLIINQEGKVLANTDRLLIGATEIELNILVKKIKALKGAVIASHIDREGFSLTGQLGFIPEDIELDGLEISARADKERMKNQYENFRLVSFSDAHILSDIDRTSTIFSLAAPTVEEIIKALAGLENRKVKI